MKKIIANNWSLVISLTLLLTFIVILLYLSLKQNQGIFSYALDDAYIHMAMAKNFYLYGVWGITKYGFTSSSSSLLWTSLLSVIYLLFGVNTVVPFILNVIFAIATIFIIYHFLNKLNIPQYYILLVLVLIIMLTPFFAVMFTGMEHMLQLFLTILFIYISFEVLYGNDAYFKYLIIVSLLFASVRYESLFLIMPMIFLFILKRKYLYSILITVSVLIPIIGYGIISVSKGWFFLPNSLITKSFLIKTDYFTLKTFMLYFFNNFTDQLILSGLLVLIFLSILFCIINIKKRKLNYVSRALLFIFILTSFMHLLFANIGWFYRYEAYLILLGIFVNSIVIYQLIWEVNFLNMNKNRILRTLALLLLFILISVPLSGRGYDSFIDTPQATTSIYEQQYQMGLFIKEFYNNDSIALNDLGAVNYLADIKCTDIYGLGNIKVAKALKNGSYNAEMVSNLLKENNVKLIVIYESWFNNIPPEWIKVCDWEIREKSANGDTKVTFYVLDIKEKDKLIKNLNNFSSKMPKSVKIKIYE